MMRERGVIDNEGGMDWHDIWCASVAHHDALAVGATNKCAGMCLALLVDAWCDRTDGASA
jgi:hypothetical protein